MTDATASSPGPVTERERVSEIDVLRGVALLGVLLVNFVALAGQPVLATEQQLAALSTAKIDSVVHFAIRWLVGDKANTVFATLFGLGFYIQLSRSEGKPGFEARYCRRLFWLLVFGWLNTTLLWVWDILNLYALAGFFLLAMRKWRTRNLVIFGVVGALYSDNLQEAVTTWMGFELVPGSHFENPAILARQAVALHGSYFANVAMWWDTTWVEWLAGGLLIAWFVYALGRFALGAAIGRSGLLDDIPRYLPLLHKVARVAIPAGLALALVARVLADKLLSKSEALHHVGQSLRSPAALILAAGYCAGIVVALHGSGWGRRLFGPFGAVGRMALTNYLAQGFLYGFILFGMGPGLGLAGSIGTGAVVLISLAFFAFQIVFSHWWLARYRFGPMEWVWRALTYGKRPPFRRREAVAAVATE